ncbi:MAG: gluconate 2-dehydrogenase gamma chain [Gammaproteobacteria bacterium]|jgi:gluconate 2-dehydrogenase gamma chain|nr:gluconate 2-dehydrogenase gamma chain [Gammaproteobacteria bacterium]
MDPVTRRCFVITLGAASLTPARRWLGKAAAAPTPAAARGPDLLSGYTFFDAAEARFIEPACERLIPADGSLPGALDAGVPFYLDRQLSGPWGEGRRCYRAGPWQPGTSAGKPRPLQPAELFRRSLRAIHDELNRRGTTFDALSPTAQHAFLAALQSGDADLDGVPATLFFDMLLKMTVEGFFTHPLHGMTRDRVPWRLLGFPGAYAARS